MTEQEIKWHEQAQTYAEEMFERVPKELQPKKCYSLSYAVQFGFSRLNDVDIRVKANGYISASISIGTCLYKTDKPFVARLWKYNGNHFFLDKNFATLQECEQFIFSNLDFFSKSSKYKDTKKSLEEVKHGYEQLLLFEM